MNCVNRRPIFQNMCKYFRSLPASRSGYMLVGISVLYERRGGPRASLADSNRSSTTTRTTRAGVRFRGGSKQSRLLRGEFDKAAGNADPGFACVSGTRVDNDGASDDRSGSIESEPAVQTIHIDNPEAVCEDIA